MVEEPKSYDIASLLANAVQPFDPADDEWISVMATEIKRGQLADPITLSRDGQVLDGSQRLRAMLHAGRKRINAEDVRILRDVGPEQALDTAISLNVRRRNVSTESKAALAKKLRNDRHWSQGRIARAFGVSQPAVSKWLAGEEASTDPVVGLDGKRYTPDPDAAARAKAEKERQKDMASSNPWHPSKGSTAKAARAALRAIKRDTEQLESLDLSALQRASLEQSLSDLVEAAEEALSRLALVKGMTQQYPTYL